MEAHLTDIVPNLLTWADTIIYILVIIYFKAKTP
jgi:hypothetical protein